MTPDIPQEMFDLALRRIASLEARLAELAPSHDRTPAAARTISTAAAAKKLNLKINGCLRLCKRHGLCVKVGSRQRVYAEKLELFIKTERKKK
jgi:hypothetical protein